MSLDASDNRPFSYQPLDGDKPQIRILCVEGPCEDSDLIRCRFEVIDLPDDGERVPSYEAISYCWGSNVEQRDIEIDGQILSVPINAAQALSWLCHRHGYRRVWIDAVCINQRDLAEKNQQVARMRWVYLHASRVLIWLGDDHHEEVSPLDKVNDYAALIKLELNPNWNTAEGQSELVELAHLTGVLDKIDKQIDWAAISALLANNWFRRVWVMQEAWLAQEALYFHHSSTSAWENVALLCLLLTAKAHQGGAVRLTGTSWFYSLIRPRDTQAEGESLRLLLASSNGLLCSQPHDGVYALLGLRYPETQLPNSLSLVTVDYSRPLLEVHAEATKACITEEGSPFCLDAVAERQQELEGRRNDPGSSSWVPPLGSVRQAQVTLDNMKSFAHADTVLHMNHTADVLSLELQGVVADRVAQILPRPTLPCSPRDPVVEARFPWIGQLMDAMDTAQHYLKCCKGSLPAWDEGSSMDSFARLWSMDRRLHALFPDNVTTEAFGVRWRELFTKLLSSKFLISILDGTPGPEALISAIQEMSKCVQVVRALSLTFDMFVTEAGRLGIGPKCMGVGDEVCIIFGEGLPVLLRPDNDNWTWVGLSFLDDIADGCCIRDLEAREILKQETKWFIIR